MEDCLEQNCEDNEFFEDISSLEVDSEKVNPYNKGNDGVGIITITPLQFIPSGLGMKVTLSDGREFSFQFPSAEGGLPGPTGEKGDKGDNITIIEQSSEETETDVINTITFSDSTELVITVPKGINGQDGTNGSNGEDGNRTYNGSEDPSPVVGNNDDYFINLVSGDFFQKISGVWTIVANIKGPSGEDGVNGNKIYRGVSVPNEVDNPANEGDLYLHILEDYDLYAFTSGTWILVGAVRGVDGEDGVDGTSIQVFLQEEEPTGGTYNDGDLWIIPEEEV